MMEISKIVACAGLAFVPMAAWAQPQEFLMVPRLSGFGYPGQNSIMLFDAQDGSVVDAGFIPGPGAEYVLYYTTAAAQVGNEIWATDQLEHVIFRFDLLGNFVGTVHGNMNNTRGLVHHNGVVYVTNGTASGATPATSIARFDTGGNYLGAFSVGLFPWDVNVLAGDLLVSHSSANGITRWALDGSPLGHFHLPGTIRGASQISHLANGNIIVAGSSSPAGLYEYDPGGNEVSAISVASPRGVYQLGNGNLLYANSSGVHIYDTTTSSSSQVIAASSSMYIGRLSFDPGAAGACCLPSGSCAALSMTDCGTQGGIFRGAGSACAAAGCPQPGACCIGSTCSLQQPQACADQNGIFYGAGTGCDAATCLSFLQSPNQATTSLINTHGAGVFLNLTAVDDLTVRRIDYFPRHPFGAEVSVDIWTRQGTYVGFIDNWDNSWTLTQTLAAVSTTGVASDSYGSPGIQNATRLMLDVPIEVSAGQTVGVYIVGTIGGVRMRGSGSALTFANNDLSVFSDTVRDSLFSGTVRTPRGFPGTIYYSLGIGPGPCYANCDGSTVEPILNVDDFTCFINEFAAAQGLPHEQQIGHYANCDASTTAPVLNVDDFTCFINAFAAGCR